MDVVRTLLLFVSWQVGGFPWVAAVGNDTESYMMNMDLCVGCLCTAVTGCDMKYECIISPSQNELCGMYRMTKPFWQDGGSILPNGTKQNETLPDWKWCAMDTSCATQTVKAYMENNNMDCNKDGRTDCYDVGLKFTFGWPSCHKEDLNLNIPSFVEYNKCLDNFSRLLWNIP